MHLANIASHSPHTLLQGRRVLLHLLQPNTTLAAIAAALLAQPMASSTLRHLDILISDRALRRTVRLSLMLSRRMMRLPLLFCRKVLTPRSGLLLAL